MNNFTNILSVSVLFRLRTNLFIGSGLGDEFTDDCVEKTVDNKLHINGYVWSSLIRRAMLRLGDGEKTAQSIGKFDTLKGVSPLWCESSIVDLPGVDIRPGIKINRKYGTADIGALYTNELVPPELAIPLRFNYFFGSEAPDEIRRRFLKMLWVIDQGIESIGGGWSYGYGKLAVTEIRMRVMDLCNPDHRGIMWDFRELESVPIVSPDPTEIVRPWISFKVSAKIPLGQLLAIHTNAPAFDRYPDYEKLPDAFVFYRSTIKEEGANLLSEIVIPGKALRQGLISVPLERALRSEESVTICDDTTKSESCNCLRCQWFGATDRGGIISVDDSSVKDAETEILHRIQLCEHSMQNNNLFSGEYLKNGRFTYRVLIDCSRDNDEATALALSARVEKHLKSMRADSGHPGGWHRIGATSSCTGQIEITAIEKKIYGEING